VTLVKRIVRVWARVEDVYMAASLCVMTAAIILEILLRYLTTGSVLGYEEVASFLMLWLFFIGAAVATRSGEHIKVDVLPLIIHNPRRLLLVDTALELVAFGICVAFAAAAYRYAWEAAIMGEVSWDLQLPLVWPKSSLAAGFSLMAIYFLPRFVRNVVRLTRPIGSDEASLLQHGEGVDSTPR